MADQQPPDDDVDLDDEARADALLLIFRRIAIWAVPLMMVGALLTALGIPLWISVVAMLVALAILVFDIEF